MATGGPTVMHTDLLTLTQWLSPSFPVGAFAYSHGLEQVVADGPVEFADWLEDVLRHGGGRSDAVLLACAYRSGDLAALDAEARAFAASRERLEETAVPGAAFARTVRDVWGLDVPDACLPVAVGAAAAARGLELSLVLQMYLHGFASNLCQAAIRLVPLGQTQAQTVLAGVLPVIAQVAQTAQSATLDDLSGCAFAADIAAMRHETMYSRIFRS